MLNTTVALGYAERVPFNATYDNIEYIIWDDEEEEDGRERGGVNDAVVSTEEAIRTIKSSQTVTAPRDTPTGAAAESGSGDSEGEGEGEGGMSDAEMDKLMTSILDKASEEFDPTSSSTTSTTTSEEEEEERELMKTRKQTRIKEHNRLLKIQQLREEKRKQEDIYIQTAAQRVIKSRLVSKRSTLKPSDLVHIAPRALVCFHQPSPTTGMGHNSDPQLTQYTPEILDMIATSLRIPSMFVFTTHPSTTDTSTPDATDNSNNSGSGSISTSSIRALHSTLIQHQAGIEDFSIRVYEGRIMKGGEAGDGRFMTHPADEYDQKIRQVYIYTY